jgi:hypothetical protein
MTEQREINYTKFKTIKTQKCGRDISQEILVARHKFLVAPGRRAGDFARTEFFLYFSR